MYINVKEEEQQMNLSDTSDDERRKKVAKAKQLQVELNELKEKLTVLKGDNNITGESKHSVEEDTARITNIYENWKRNSSDKKEFIVNGTHAEKTLSNVREKLLTVMPLA